MCRRKGWRHLILSRQSCSPQPTFSLKSMYFNHHPAVLEVLGLDFIPPTQLIFSHLWTKQKNPESPLVAPGALQRDEQHSCAEVNLRHWKAGLEQHLTAHLRATTSLNQTATAAQSSPHSSENSKDTPFSWLNLNTTTLKKYKCMCPFFEPTAPGKPRGMVSDPVHHVSSLMDVITAVETINQISVAMESGNATRH